MRKALRAKLAFDVADQTSRWSSQKLYDFLAVFEVEIKNVDKTFSTDDGIEIRSSKVRRLLLADVSNDTLLLMADFLSADDDVDDLLVGLSNEDSRDSWFPTIVELADSVSDEIIEAVEEAIDEIASNNGYASSEPTERNAIVASLRSGLTALREKVFTKGAIIETLYRPFLYLSKKFADSAIGIAAKKAAVTLMEIL